MATSLDELLQRIGQRDRRALAQLIRRVDDGEDLRELLEQLPQASARAPVVGITGSAGVGKSTLMAALVEHLRKQNKSVGVLACDPQSPVSGGCLMGDRIRVRFDPADESVFFRSFSTRGTAGGLSATIRPAIELMRRFGFDLILVETVGVGQDEFAVRDTADVVALVVAPGAGDEVQWLKAGLIELADLIVVNKADLPGADQLAAELEQTLALGGRPIPRIVKVTAPAGTGIPALLDELERLASAPRR